MRGIRSKALAIMLAVMVAMSFSSPAFAGSRAADGGKARVTKTEQEKAPSKKGQAKKGKAKKQVKNKSAKKKAAKKKKTKKKSDKKKTDKKKKVKEKKDKAEKQKDENKEEVKVESGEEPKDESRETRDPKSDAEDAGSGDSAQKDTDTISQEEENSDSQTEEPAAEETAEEAGDSASVENSDKAGGRSAGKSADKEKTSGYAKYIEVSDATSLEDGTYKAGDFSFSGGTGRTALSCDKVTVSGGRAKATLRISSTQYTHLFTGTIDSQHDMDEENTDLYDAESAKAGEGVYKMSADGSAVIATIPVSLGKEMQIAGRTTATTEAHWIQFKVTVNAGEKLSDQPDQETASDADTSDSGTEDPGKDDQEKEEEPAGESGELTAGTWKVKATTVRKMFYLYPKEEDPAWTILKIKKDGSMTANITLSGDGYDYVYMGTAEQAKSAPSSSWIPAKIVKGYYTFTVPVSALDKKLDITPHSRKYEEDGNPDTEPWRPDKWIIFYSSGAEKTNADSIETEGKPEKDNTSGTQTKFKKDKKADKVSKWKDDRGKSTSAVDNSTSLKDGVYSPDRFSWSGGSGRLAYIRCDKITVRGGKAYATIEFGSTHYDSLKANGRVYSKQGGGNSRFVIPVKLNANNTIIGRTTAMSMPHWIKYTIFVYKAGATGGRKGAAGTDGHVTNTNKLSDKAPDLLGLKADRKEKIEYAKYFRIFHYENDITLICIDQSTDTALEKEEKKSDSQEKAKKSENQNQPVIQYDEEGKPIAQTDTERTNELYKNNVVNYLVAPADAELPAGLEKDCVIIRKPVKNAYIASREALNRVAELNQIGAVASAGMAEEDIASEDAVRAMRNGELTALGDYENPPFPDIVMAKTDLAVLPSGILPAKLAKGSSREEKAESERIGQVLVRLQTRFASLDIPLMIDRSEDEVTNYGSAEWVRVYGSIFGEEKAAEQLLKNYMQKNKKVNTEHE